MLTVRGGGQLSCRRRRLLKKQLETDRLETCPTHESTNHSGNGSRAMRVVALAANIEQSARDADHARGPALAPVGETTGCARDPRTAAADRGGDDGTIRRRRGVVLSAL